MKIASPAMARVTPPHIPGPTGRPQAVLSVTDNAVACVCAWCADKDEADDWCLAEGFDMTHTVRPTCRARSINEYEQLTGGNWSVQSGLCPIA